MGCQGMQSNARDPMSRDTLLVARGQPWGVLGFHPQAHHAALFPGIDCIC